MQALTAASRVPDFELAARLALCDPIVAGAADLPREIARQRRLVSPVMLLIDGDAPRVAETQTLQAKDYATTLATFLRRAIPLTPAWLAPRVARLERRHPAEVREARRGMTGSAILVPSQIAAAGMLVALEAVRSDQERRRDLLGRLASAAASPVNLFAPPAPSKHSVLRPEEDTF
jgi:hypothetical protein